MVVPRVPPARFACHHTLRSVRADRVAAPAYLKTCIYEPEQEQESTHGAEHYTDDRAWIGARIEVGIIAGNSLGRLSRMESHAAGQVEGRNSNCSRRDDRFGGGMEVLCDCGDRIDFARCGEIHGGGGGQP